MERLPGRPETVKWLGQLRSSAAISICFVKGRGSLVGRIGLVMQCPTRILDSYPAIPLDTYCPAPRKFTGNCSSCKPEIGSWGRAAGRPNDAVN